VKARDYQSDCIDLAWKELQAEQAASLVVLPTGTGKTVVFSTLADQWVKAGLGRVLILAHRFELIDQAAKKFAAVAGFKPSIEMADSYAESHGFNWANKVVVGSVPTMRGRRLNRWDPNYFSLIIVDEAHHATAGGYVKIFEHFNNARVLGVTATPDRADKKSLGRVFRSVAYQLGIREAIGMGWLVPIRQKFIHVDSIDVSGVDTSKGDLDLSQLDRVMRVDENIHRIAKPTFELAGNRPTLVFATSVAHSKEISDVLNSYKSGCSEYVASYRITEDGGQEAYCEDLRAREVAKFKEGSRQFLVSCGVFLEGFDSPPTACIAMARPTKSRSLYAQALGRGTRPLDGLVDCWPTAEERIQAILNSAKPDTLVLDFVGNSGKHKLVYADEILFPEATEEQRLKAREKMRDKKDGADVQQAMEQAGEEIKEEKERSIDLLRRSLASRLRAEFFTTDVDPFGYDPVPVPTPVTKAFHTPPSDKQVRYVMYLAKKADKRFDADTVRQMPRKQVQAIIGRLQRQVEAMA
jgi:superfamily II DNA or RNA helicase